MLRVRWGKVFEIRQKIYLNATLSKGKIFETVEKECCLDGSVKKIGMCGEVYVDTGSADYDMLAFYEDADSLQIQGF